MRIHDEGFSWGFRLRLSPSAFIVAAVPKRNDRTGNDCANARNPETAAKKTGKKDGEQGGDEGCRFSAENQLQQRKRHRDQHDARQRCRERSANARRPAARQNAAACSVVKPAS